MADKKVNLIISLKDGVSSGLHKIGGAVSATVSAFKKLAVAGLAMSGVVIGGLTALAKAYAAGETSQKRLKATFDALGESGSRAVVKWSAFATAIQRVTTLGDEAVMDLVSMLKTMGVANDKMEEATRGAIGLSKAFGIDLNSSAKMVALAMQGEYEMLGRYIPQLRTATTDAEKFAIVQKAMANGFKVAKSELNSVSGQWSALKEVIGDAMETAGKAMFGDGGLIKGIENLKNKIIELTDNGTIEKWAGQAKDAFQSVVDTVKLLTDKDSNVRAEAFKNLGKGVSDAFMQAVEVSMKLMIEKAPSVGTAIWNGMVSGMKGIASSAKGKLTESLSPQFERAEAEKAVDERTRAAVPWYKRTGKLYTEKDVDEEMAVRQRAHDDQMQYEIAKNKAAKEKQSKDTVDIDKKTKKQVGGTPYGPSSVGKSIGDVERKKNLTVAMADLEKTTSEETIDAAEKALKIAIDKRNITKEESAEIKRTIDYARSKLKPPPSVTTDKNDGGGYGVPLYGQPGQNLSWIQSQRMSQLNKWKDRINSTGNLADVSSFKLAMKAAEDELARSGAGGSSLSSIVAQGAKPSQTKELEKTNATLGDIYGVLDKRLGGVS